MNQHENKNHTESKRSVFAEPATFLAAFLRKPGQVGAVAPSSRHLASAMIDGCGLKTAETVAELGPGTGSFTRLILEEIGRETTFFALELEPAYLRRLKQRFPDLEVYRDSAERIGYYLEQHGKKQADCVICGLPWAGFPRSLQDRIMDSVVTSLKPGGCFHTFAYIHARCLPGAIQFRKDLFRRFSRVETSPIVWRNLPPAFVYRCRR